jgi:hypothetical protein
MITPEFKIGDKFIAIKDDYTNSIVCGEVYTLTDISNIYTDVTYGIFTKDNFMVPPEKNYTTIPIAKCNYFFKKYINFIKSYTIKINQKI